MNRTGTSSIGRCLELLGLTPIAAPGTLTAESYKLIDQLFEDRNFDPILNLAENYQSFEGRPWNMWEMYRYLDIRFPDSLFVLTMRDPESWWRSTRQWIAVNEPLALDRYQLHLRVPDLSKESMLHSFHRHNREISQYFEGTGKLLRINLEAGEGWDKLCKFLDLPAPGCGFPHINRQPCNEADEKSREEGGRLQNGVLCDVCGHVTTPGKATLTGESRVDENMGVSTYGSRALRRLHRNLPKCKEQIKDNLASSTKSLFYYLYKAGLVVNSRMSAAEAAPLRAPRFTSDPQELAVVSCFFNPSRSQRRVRNFKKFYAGVQSTGVHCLVVELVFGSSAFQLEDGENAIKLRTDGVMWHKERLLNIGIKQLLFQGYKKIVWLDGDITFDNKDWPRLVADKLNSVNLCQVFGTVVITGPENCCPEVGTSGVKYFLEKKHLYKQSPVNLSGLMRGRLRGGQSGFGWAARAEVLKKQLLYDKAIVGGGDKLIFAASLAADRSDRRFQALTHSSVACEKCDHQNQSAAYTRYYLDWAECWAAAVDNKVGYVDLQIRDMYHGRREDRKYHERREILYRHQFDPAHDLSTDEMDCLAWGSDKQDLHRDVESYFLARREDV
jgi:hypothetical protein